jgi:integrase
MKNPKSGPVVAQLIGPTNLRFWENRVEKRKFKQGGKNQLSVNYYVRLFHEKKRKWMNLETPNRTKAAELARESYFLLRTGGWTALENSNGQARKMPKDSRKLTLGQYFRLVEDRCFISDNTLYEYQSSARNLYSRAFSVGKGLSKYDYVNGGNEAWREKVESIPVFSITLAQIERHRKAFLSARKVEELQSGRTTFNKVLRNTKALFGRKVRRILEKTNSNPTGVEFPDDFPFDKLQMEKEGSKRFHLNRHFVGTDLETLIADARQEFYESSEHSPGEGGLACYLILVLASVAGLRRREIDDLHWDAIDWEGCQIDVRPSGGNQLKTTSSDDTVEVDREVIELLRKVRLHVQGEFVVPGPEIDSPNAHRRHYRCGQSFRQVIAWLREKGVQGHSPLHILRKAIGSHICEKAGIYAASRFLRHSTVSVTEKYYLNKKRVVSGLGKLVA